MTVSFNSAYMDVAMTLFQETFTKDEEPITSSFTGPLIHFFFPDDTLIRDARSWCSDAFGCGLIYNPGITVNY